jgi:hypothetical protein
MLILHFGGDEMNKQKQEAVAVERIQLITPLLDPNLDPAKEKMLRQQICQQSGLSDRTIRRYLSSYKSRGKIVFLKC